jgi:3-dehydroquinate dehydratase II
MTDSKPILVFLSGPNLNLLGLREPEVYGTETLDDRIDAGRAVATELGYEVEHLQSNHEGDLVDAVHAARDRATAIIINGGAFTHYSWAIHDALATFAGPIVELHISNPGARDSWRADSVITPVATGVISGFGTVGYDLAVRAAHAELTRRAQAAV